MTMSIFSTSMLVSKPINDPFPVSINLLLIILSTTAVITLIAFITCACLKKHVKFLGISGLILCCIIISIMIPCKIAKPHGLYTTDITLYELYHGINNTPIEDELPDDLSGSIILFYRFGCPDCESIYDELFNYVKDAEHVYWVSTRSEQGKRLIAQYPIETVPTGIYISRDTDDAVPIFVKKTLDTKSDDGAVILDTEAIDRLLYLQKQKR